MIMRPAKHVFKRVLWNARAESVIGAALLVAILLLVKGLLRVAGAQSAVTPFVLRTETYSFEKDSKGRLVATAVEARRSNGTRTRVGTYFFPGGDQRAFRSIVYPDGGRVQLVDAISAKTTWPPLQPKEIAAERADHLQFSNNNCVYSWEALLSYDVLFGQRVAVVKTVPTNVFGTTYWRSPDLDCEALQSRVETVKAGRVVVQTEQRAVSLELEEPDARLDEGTNYAELRPSELQRKEVEKEGLSWNVDLQKQGQLEDDRYSTRKKIAAGPPQ